jgi:hypothetical protein
VTGTTIAGTSGAILLVTTVQNPLSIAAGGYVLGSSYAIGSNTSLDWTITNAGTLQSGGTGALSDGIVLEAGAGTSSTAVIGYIDNTRYGAIHGYDTGVWMQAAGTVLNQGTITSIYGKNASKFGYSYSAGVFTPLAGAVLLGGGSVTNAASALISSYVEAVNVGEAGTVLNAGTIQATGSHGAFGVVLPAGGTVVNQAGGTISGMDAILAFAGDTSVTNAAGGTIAGSNFGIDVINATATLLNGGVVSSGARTAIGLGQGGIVSNIAGGTIAGAEYGLYANGPVTLMNAGSIIGTSQVGAVVLAAATISNAAAGFIAGHYDGIYVGGSAASTITNSGTLLGIAGDGVGVGAGGTVVNTSNGTITGHAFGILGVHAADTVTNAGTIVSGQTRYGAGVGLTAGGIVTNQFGGYIGAQWKGVQIGASYTASIGGTVVNDGTIIARDVSGNGAGVWIHGPGLVVNAPGAAIVGGADGVVAYYQTTLVNQGTISGGENAFIAVKAGFADRLIVSPGAEFQGLVNGGNAIGSAVYTTLELTTGASAGTIAGFGTQFVNIGKIELDAGATWSLGGSVATGQIIQFDGTGTSLTLLNPTQVAGTVVSFGSFSGLPTLTGFGIGDTLVLAGVTDVTGVTVGSGSVLSITQASGPAMYLQLDGTDGQTLAFSTTDGATDITVACFAEGTRITTPRGAIAVERLREGNAVLTASGASHPIQWIGRRTLDCRRHPAPDRVKPILIARHAFGHNRPKRPLRLSPDHSIFIDDLLIPAKLLVNGTTVMQVDVGTITYYHLELAHHDVVLAEGLPTETYLETGGRSAFENGGAATQLHPDFTPDEARVAMVWRNFAYAPLVGSEEQLNPIRARLASQAAMLGYPTDGMKPRRSRTAAA